MVGGPHANWFWFDFCGKRSFSIPVGSVIEWERDKNLNELIKKRSRIEQVVDREICAWKTEAKRARRISAK